MEVQCTACETPIEISSTQISKQTATVSCACGEEVFISQAQPVMSTFRLVSSSEEQISPSTAEPPPVQESTPAPLPPKTEATLRPRLSSGAPRPAPRVTSLTTAAHGTSARPGSWRSCVNHPRVRSEEMCPACAVGYCVECKKIICPTCDSVCMPTNEYSAWQVRERQRARPLRDELSTIFRYPLQDRLAFILLALFTGLFGFATCFTVYAVPFSQGVLLWYSFHSLYQVAKGNMHRAMPEFNDISDLYRPLRLSAGVLLIGWAPALLLMVMLGSSLGLGEFGGNRKTLSLWNSPHKPQETRNKRRQWRVSSKSSKRIREKRREHSRLGVKRENHRLCIPRVRPHPARQHRKNILLACHSCWDWH